MIISRSQSELDLPNGIYDSEDDVWFNQDKLFQVRKSSISAEGVAIRNLNKLFSSSSS